MPPILALSGCIVFVAILLWIERRADRYSSWVLLVPTTWLLIVASRPLGTWFLTTSRGSFEDGSPADRIVLTALICLSLALLFSQGRIGKANASIQMSLIMLFAFLALSIVWSDYPFVSLKRWIRLCGAVLIALLIALEKDPVNALLKIVRRIGYILIPLSLILIKYYPRLGSAYSRWSGELMWNGVTLTKNALGQLCLLTIVGLVFANYVRLRAPDRSISKSLLVADLGIVVLALYLMVGTPSGSYSATAITVLAIVIGSTLLLLRYPSSAGRLTAMLCAGAVAGWFVMLFFQGFVAQTSRLLGRDETLTGRTEIWAKALADAAVHPILGSGFGGYFGTDNEFTATYGNEGHNGILDVYVETGAVGVAVLLIFLFSLFVAIRRTISEDVVLGVFAVSVLLMNLLANFTESLFAKSNSYLWTMLISVSVVIHVTRRTRMLTAATVKPRPIRARIDFRHAVGARPDAFPRVRGTVPAASGISESERSSTGSPEAAQSGRMRSRAGFRRGRR